MNSITSIRLSFKSLILHRAQLTASCSRVWGTFTHLCRCAANVDFFTTQLFAQRFCTAAIGGFSPAQLFAYLFCTAANRVFFFSTQLFAQRFCTAAIGGFFSCTAVCTAVLQSKYLRLFFPLQLFAQRFCASAIESFFLFLRSCLHGGSAQLLFFCSAYNYRSKCFSVQGLSCMEYTYCEN